MKEQIERIRAYAFLSQIFDYGNTDIEARSIFFRRLSPLLEFGRQREIVDTSSIVLTHHKLSNKGNRQLPLGSGMGEPLQALYAAGSGTIQEKERALLAEIIAKVNDLFQGDVSDDDQLIYVNNVLKGKLLQGTDNAWRVAKGRSARGLVHNQQSSNRQEVWQTEGSGSTFDGRRRPNTVRVSLLSARLRHDAT